jgi:hypothetical protein
MFNAIAAFVARDGEVIAVADNWSSHHDDVFIVQEEDFEKMDISVIRDALSTHRSIVANPDRRQKFSWPESFF